MPAIFSSLIQSDFRNRDGHGNFELVVKVGRDLWHYWRDATDHIWRAVRLVCSGQVAFPGAIVQSTMGDGDHGNFEVVVPLEIMKGQVQLWHFIHFNNDTNSPWVRSQAVTSLLENVTGPASLIQSNFGSGPNGNLELVVPLQGLSGHDELWHFFHDSANPASPWVKSKRVTGADDRVMGPGCLIQSDYGATAHGNFEVVVPIAGDSGNMELWHYFHDNNDIAGPWQRAQSITMSNVVTGPGIILRSDFGDLSHRNFEVVVPVRTPHGNIELRHFWHDTDTTTLWRPGGMITASANGWTSFIESNYEDGGHDTFEVLIEECCAPTIVHYSHDNGDPSNPWVRQGPLIDEILPSERPVSWLANTHKIVQLTGEYDLQGWDGDPAHRLYAFNRTEDQAKIIGCDLGSSFIHNDRLCFLFGDTWRIGQSKEETNLDSIAFCTDPSPEPDKGLKLNFNSAPPLASAFSQDTFNVPLEGVSFRGEMFVFFSTDHRIIGGYNLMGRSVVASSNDDGYHFTYLWDFSADKFINVSVDFANGSDLGLPGFGHTMLIWGSGRYRSSDVYLAAMPAEEIASGRFRRFYAGVQNRQPVWSDDEDQAVPLFCAGCVGELSVRWNSFVNRWLIFYNSDNPKGIVMRSAASPWGDWSGPVLIFEGTRNRGYGQFMHIPWNWPGNPRDFAFDSMFGYSRENEFGDAYGPYQIAPLSSGEPGVSTRIYFAMSTWNPYQVVLMATDLNSGGPELPGTVREPVIKIPDWIVKGVNPHRF